MRTLEALLDVVDDGRERIDLLVQLASVEEEHFLKPDVAALRLEQVLEIDPNDKGAYFDLERNYRKRRQWSELVATYERHIAATLERKAKIGLFDARSRASTPTRWAPARRRSTRIAPSSRSTTRTSPRSKRSRSSTMEAATPRSPSSAWRASRCSPPSRRRARRRCTASARRSKTRLGDRRAARERYEQALDLDPSRIFRRWRRCGKSRSTKATSRRRRGTSTSSRVTCRRSRHRAKLLVELAKLRDEQLGDHKSAVLVWEAALEADPESEESRASAGRRVHRRRKSGRRRSR